MSDVRKILRKEWLNDTQDGRKKEQLRNATKLAKTTYRRKKKQTLEKVLKEIEEDRGQGGFEISFKRSRPSAMDTSPGQRWSEMRRGNFWWVRKR